MKHKNQHIWSHDLEFLQRIASEQDEYIGRDYELKNIDGQYCLVIFALPKNYKRKDKGKKKRNKRNEKFERRAS